MQQGFHVIFSKLHMHKNTHTMTYKETTDYLFNSTPLFQNVGKDAYKEGLQNTFILDEHFGHPHKHYKTIHIAGTNGKGSCSHTIASILQDAGYKVGLYTSPHLVDFRERIRVNGEMISEEAVISFVEENKSLFEEIHPSFFEITTALAFKYFMDKNVDIAVIEVGLGGRLDCTNIIKPEACIITNISFDHMQFLGNTLEKIAAEKAGIIKHNVPVIIGETTSETRKVFERTAEDANAPIIFAEDNNEISSCEINSDSGIDYTTVDYGVIHGELGGLYQEKNTNTILNAVNILRQTGICISKENVLNGFKNVCKTTGLRGRWQIIGKEPLIICDTGHNVGGFEYLSKQITAKLQTHKHTRIVFGMVNDKDIDGVLKMLPKEASYYFCKASVKRALDEHVLTEKAIAFGLKGKTFTNVKEAYISALHDSEAEDFIFVGGSSFIVADLLTYLDDMKQINKL